MKKILTLFVFASLIACEPGAQVQVQQNVEEPDYPEPIGYVSDFEKIFKTEEKAVLERMLREYDVLTGNQIVVATIDENLTAENFDSYVVDLSNYWEIGTKEKDNGLTVIFSPELRKIRISTGKGTEKILTDVVCQEIITAYILPEFRKDQYYQGIKNGVEELIKRWK